MGIIMNMSNYEVERDDALEAEYGEEVLCSGWNPAIALACQQHAFPATERQLMMPSSLATVDAEAFLRKMYIWQS